MKKAQSEVIGIVLLLTISITAISIIVLSGQPILSGASDNVQFDRMENEFSLLDARMSSSALGATESQSVSLNVGQGRLESNPEASWMRVEYENITGTPQTLANITMGNLRYVQGDRTIGYEGGGVWKKKLNENFTEMVSTPEFHYRGSTLTLPAYNITGRDVVGGSVRGLTIESGGDPDLIFPDSNLDNPLEKGNATITVKSEYYRGWETFFRERTTGSIERVDDEEQKVVFTLEVPTELLLNAGVRYLPGGGAQAPPAAATIESSSEIEIDLPDADTLVQPELDKCFPNPGSEPDCVDLTTVSTGTSLNESKIYYVNESGEYTIQERIANDANVTIVVNGDMEYNNDFSVGSGNEDPVEVYADGDVNLQGGNVNTNPDSGNASMFITYATGKITVDSPGTGTINYTGVIFAPETDQGGCSEKIAGDTTITGSVVVYEVCLKGNADIYYSDDLDVLDLSPDVSLIRFLHITENEVRMDG